MVGTQIQGQDGTPGLLVLLKAVLDSKQIRHRTIDSDTLGKFIVAEYSKSRLIVHPRQDGCLHIQMSCDRQYHLPQSAFDGALELTDRANWGLKVGHWLFDENDGEYSFQVNTIVAHMTVNQIVSCAQASIDVVRGTYSRYAPAYAGLLAGVPANVLCQAVESGRSGSAEANVLRAVNEHKNQNNVGQNPGLATILRAVGGNNNNGGSRGNSGGSRGNSGGSRGNSGGSGSSGNRGSAGNAPFRLPGLGSGSSPGSSGITGVTVQLSDRVISGEIDLGDLKFDSSDCKRLGKGGMGEVFMAHYDDHPVAVKVIRAEVLLGDGDQRDAVMQQFIQETKVHSSVSHPNVIHVYGYVKTDNCILLVQELARNRSVYELLHPDDGQPRQLDMPTRLKLMLQTAQGLKYLHRKNVVHLDVKPPNLLLTERMEVKVADFGLATIMDDRTHIDNFASGTPAYMAPELLQNRVASKKTDVHAFAIAAYEMLTGLYPFHDQSFNSNVALYMAIAGGQRPRWPANNNIPQSARSLVERCWAPEPNDRPDFREIVENLRNIVATM